MDKAEARIYSDDGDNVTAFASSSSAGALHVSPSPTSEPRNFPTVHPLACFRISPRPCVNYELVADLKVLRWHRFLEYGCTFTS